MYFSLAAPKVVSIPIHFVGSDTKPSTSSASDDKLSTSATKIQKVFRGFLVRKSIKEILAIGSDVDKAERKVLNGLDSIRRDPKERLKMNETLMGLLFKLDSVRGVGPGVRDCRKAVIKKAIVLQEIIDGCDESCADVAIQAVKTEGEEFGTGMECDDHDSKNTKASGTDVVYHDNVAENSNQGLEIEDLVKKTIVLHEEIDGCDKSGGDAMNQNLKIEGESFGSGMECNDTVTEYSDQGHYEDMVESGKDSELLKCNKFADPEVGDKEDYCMVKQVVVGEGEDYDTEPMAKQVEIDCLNGNAVLKTQDHEVKSENSRDKMILERMMEENEKMTSMMKHLSEQNQAQTHMLSLLSQRVEQLEKAFVREKSRKKSKDKKKRMANGVTDGLDVCPDRKKCGKKS